MVKMSKEIVLICATATMLSVTPYSIEASKTAGVGIEADQAQARVGRTTRRTVARHSYYGHHHCAWVNGVHVCR